MEEEQNISKDSSGTPSGFEESFSRFLARRRRIEFSYSLARLLLLACIILVLYGLIDSYFPLDNPDRMIISGSLAGLFLVASLVFLILSHRFCARKAAREIDSLYGSSGKVLSSWELDHPSHPEADKSELKSWLAARTRNQAGEQVAALSWSKLPPFKKWLRQAGFVLLLLLLICSLGHLFPGASSTLAGRLFSPWRDVAPLSPYTFELVDFPDEVIYGDDALLQVNITGGELKSPVVLLVKSQGLPVQELNAFKENTGIWARLLEKMTVPCEVAFGTADGRARSNWHKIAISYQPKVVSGYIKSIPPAYTKTTETTVPISGQEIPVIDGGTVEYTLKCNRIPSQASATFKPDREEIPAQQIEGVINPDQTIVFRIPVRHSGQVSMDITDYKGTRMARPLESKIRAIPDQRPTLSIHKPEPVSISLPDQFLSFQAEAKDDFGLSRVSWLRRAGDTRMRDKPMPVGVGRKEYFLDEMIYLPNIGVKAGDILEFSVEAKDENPLFLNIATAQAVKVFIISEEEARQILREQMALDEFMLRFNMASRQIEEILEALDQAMENKDPAKQNELIAALQEKHQAAQKTMEELASDFPLFNEEKELSALAKQLQEKLKANQDDLAKLDKNAELAPQLQELKNRLQEPRKELADLEKQAEDQNNIARAHEQIIKFQLLTNEQKELQEQLAAYEDELRKLRPVTIEQLKAIAKNQEELRKKLEAWENETILSILNLPITYAGDLKENLDQFMKSYKEAMLPSMMGVVSDRAEDGQHYSARIQAEKVYENMKRLLKENKATSSCLQGECSGLSGMSESASQTAQDLLRSLLAAMLGKGGKGSGGFGTGGGGSGGFGSPTGIPINGVKRNKIGSLSSGRSGGKDSSPGSTGNNNQASSKNVVTEQTPGGESGSETENTAESLDGPTLESIPPSYRNAVKKYFSQL